MRHVYRIFVGKFVEKWPLEEVRKWEKWIELAYSLVQSQLAVLFCC
jgi:hypothetical protein